MGERALKNDSPYNFFLVNGKRQTAHDLVLLGIFQTAQDRDANITCMTGYLFVLH